MFSLARSCGCGETPILPAQRTLSSVLRDQFAEWVGGSRVILVYVTRAPDLPDYDRPPIDEVAIGYLFPSVQNFSDSLVGAFWQTVRDEYPRMDSQPRVEAPMEVLDSDLTPTQRATVPRFGPNQGRTWLISRDDQFVVQIQDNRFVLNWRKRNAVYPHFDDIMLRFRSIFDSYVRFLVKSEAGEPGIQQFEVTYINWVEEQDAAAFFRPARTATIDERNFSIRPTSIAWAIRYLINGPDGKPRAGLHVQTVPLMRLEPLARGFQLQLMFRAPLVEQPTDARLEELAEAARDSIVRTFTALTTEEAHKLWERTQ